MIFTVAFSMAELTSKYPTAGGPYWWAHDLGGNGWSWMTGWFNIVGLLGIVASAPTARRSSSTSSSGSTGSTSWGQLRRHRAHPRRAVLLFLIILLLYTLVNIFADRLLALMNNISVGWHLARRRGDPRDPLDRPRHSPERRLRLHRAVQPVRLLRRLDQQLRLLVLRAADRLPADDVHGDRLRRLGAHRRGDRRRRQSAAQGVWRSVFFSAIIGWIVLLSFLFAANDVAAIDEERGTRPSASPRRSIRGRRSDRHPDRHGRSVLLRPRADQRLADLVRVLPRPGDPGLVHLAAGEQGPGAVQRGDRGLASR